MKWSSSPRWVSNSLNPTGHRAGLSKPDFPLLLPPLTLFQRCSSYLTPPVPPPSPFSLCLSFQRGSSELMRLGWRSSSTLSPTCVCIHLLARKHIKYLRLNLLYLSASKMHINIRSFPPFICKHKWTSVIRISEGPGNTGSHRLFETRIPSWTLRSGRQVFCPIHTARRCAPPHIRWPS